MVIRSDFSGSIGRDIFLGSDGDGQRYPLSLALLPNPPWPLWSMVSSLAQRRSSAFIHLRPSMKKKKLAAEAIADFQNSRDA